MVNFPFFALPFTVSTWKRHRKLISPAFNQQVLDGFMPIFNSQGRKLVSKLAAEAGKGLFDHSPYVRQNFMETICRKSSLLPPHPFQLAGSSPQALPILYFFFRSLHSSTAGNRPHKHGISCVVGLLSSMLSLRT